MSLSAVNSAHSAAAEVQVLLAGFGLKESGGKAGYKNWRKRYFVLRTRIDGDLTDDDTDPSFTHVLLYYKSQLSAQTEEPSGAIPMVRGKTVVEGAVKKGKDSLKISTPGSTREYHFIPSDGVSGWGPVLRALDPPSDQTAEDKAKLRRMTLGKGRPRPASRVWNNKEDDDGPDDPAADPAYTGGGTPARLGTGAGAAGVLGLKPAPAPRTRSSVSGGITATHDPFAAFGSGSGAAAPPPSAFGSPGRPPAATMPGGGAGVGVAAMARVAAQAQHASTTPASTAGPGFSTPGHNSHHTGAGIPGRSATVSVAVLAADSERRLRRLLSDLDLLKTAAPTDRPISFVTSPDGTGDRVLDFGR